MTTTEIRVTWLKHNCYTVGLCMIIVKIHGHVFCALCIEINLSIYLKNLHQRDFIAFLKLLLIRVFRNSNSAFNQHGDKRHLSLLIRVL